MSILTQLPIVGFKIDKKYFNHVCVSVCVFVCVGV